MALSPSAAVSMGPAAGESPAPTCATCGEASCTPGHDYCSRSCALRDPLNGAAPRLRMLEAQSAKGVAGVHVFVGAAGGGASGLASTAFRALGRVFGSPYVQAAPLRAHHQCCAHRSGTPSPPGTIHGSAAHARAAQGMKMWRDGAPAQALRVVAARLLTHACLGCHTQERLGHGRGGGTTAAARPRLAQRHALRCSQGPK